jgi:hypothetical protein
MFNVKLSISIRAFLFLIKGLTVTLGFRNYRSSILKPRYPALTQFCEIGQPFSGLNLGPEFHIQ